MDAWTLMALMGTAAIAVGIGMYSLPAGIIAAGVILLATGVSGAVRKATARPTRKEAGS